MTIAAGLDCGNPPVRVSGGSRAARRSPLGGVYFIIHDGNGHVYIGEAARFHQRLTQHFAALRRGDHHCRSLQNLFNLDGEKMLTFGILLHTPSGSHAERFHAEAVAMQHYAKQGRLLNPARKPFKSRGCALSSEEIGLIIQDCDARHHALRHHTGRPITIADVLEYEEGEAQ